MTDTRLIQVGPVDAKNEGVALGNMDSDGVLRQRCWVAKQPCHQTWHKNTFGHGMSAGQRESFWWWIPTSPHPGAILVFAPDGWDGRAWPDNTLPHISSTGCESDPINHINRNMADGGHAMMFDSHRWSRDCFGITDDDPPVPLETLDIGAAINNMLWPDPHVAIRAEIAKAVGNTRIANRLLQAHDGYICAANQDRAKLRAELAEMRARFEAYVVREEENDQSAWERLRAAFYEMLRTEYTPDPAPDEPERLTATERVWCEFGPKLVGALVAAWPESETSRRHPRIVEIDDALKEAADADTS